MIIKTKLNCIFLENLKITHIYTLKTHISLIQNKQRHIILIKKYNKSREFNATGDACRLKLEDLIKKK
jgi:hypothetical protein